MEIDNKTDIHRTLSLGKIAEVNKRRENLAEVSIGFTYIRGNDESYFSVTGFIWNRIHTDIVHGGRSVQDYLLENFFPNDKTLKRICDLGRKWHLTRFSRIPEDAREEIFALMDELERKETT